MTENSHTISHTTYLRFCDLRSAILYQETIFRETTVQFSTTSGHLLAGKSSNWVRHVVINNILAFASVAFQQELTQDEDHHGWLSVNFTVG
jgi:hypothetical protein